MTKEIAVKTENNPVSIEGLLQQAITNKVPVETLERLLAMRKELKAERAKEDYNNSMGEFQSECPVIQKTKAVTTRDGTVAYKYAPIESIVTQVKSLLQKHGFSYAVQTETSDKRVKSVCIVKHVGGHSENYEVEVPLGNKTQVMSDSQVVASALTFAKRYAFCNAFGILTGDEDIDGKDIKPDVVDQFAKAEKMIKACTNISVLIEYDEKMKKGKSFTTEQKEKMSAIISARVGELEKNETTKS
jgi:hypothetical protein